MRNNPNRERLRPRARAMGRAFGRALVTEYGQRNEMILKMIDRFERPGPWEDEIIDELLRQETTT